MEIKPMLIFFSSDKGGCGKTTTLSNLAGALAARGASVHIIDRDPLGNASKWADKRAKTDRPKVSAFWDLAGGIEGYKIILEAHLSHDHVLIDTPGHKDEATLALMYYMAQHTISEMQIVVPLKLSQHDFDSNVTYAVLLWQKMQRMREAAPPRVSFVLNEAPTHYRTEELAAKKVLAALPVPLNETVIHNRKAYRESAGNGLSVVEMNNDKAAQEFSDLIGELGLDYVSNRSDIEQNTERLQ